MSDREKRIVVLHGPNLDPLGERPAEHYGAITLAALERMVTDEALRLGWTRSCLLRRTMKGPTSNTCTPTAGREPCL